MVSGDRTCACGAVLGPKNKSGVCRACNAHRLNNDPAIRERMIEGRTAYFARPGVKEGYAQRIAAYMANMPDAEREKRRERGRRVYRDVLSTPEVRARTMSPDARARAGRSRTDTVLAWCPPELRDHYRFLIRQHHYSAAEARKVIEADIPGTEEHARRAVAAQALKLRLKHEREVGSRY